MRAWLSALLLLGCSYNPIAKPEEDTVKPAPFVQLGPRGGAPLVYPVPPRQGFWTGSNNIGAEVAFVATNNNRQRILKMDEWGPPERWTISLGVQFSDVLDANHVFEAQANILFGVGGSTNNATVDFITGSTLSVVANTITIDCTWTALTVNGPPSDVRLSALISRGNSSFPVNAIFTVPTGSITNGTSTAIRRIPNFARRIHVLPLTGSFSNIYTPTSFIQFHGDAAGGTNAGAVFGDMLFAHAGLGVPIPGQAKFWKFTNNAAGATAALVFFDIEP